MINKQNLWFLTLFSLILVLSIYYITMPNELLLQTTNEEETTEEITTTISESSSLNAMRVSLEEERDSLITELQEKLTSEEVTTEEKNNAYEQLKYLNEVQGKEEELEKIIKETLSIDCFVKINNQTAESVCISEEHSNNLANEVMRLIQEKYENKMNITVKFQKG